MRTRSFRPRLESLEARDCPVTVTGCEPVVVVYDGDPPYTTVSYDPGCLLTVDLGPFGTVAFDPEAMEECPDLFDQWAAGSSALAAAIDADYADLEATYLAPREGGAIADLRARVRWLVALREEHLAWLSGHAAAYAAWARQPGISDLERNARAYQALYVAALYDEAARALFALYDADTRGDDELVWAASVYQDEVLAFRNARRRELSARQAERDAGRFADVVTRSRLALAEREAQARSAMTEVVLRDTLFAFHGDPRLPSEQ